MGRFFAAPRAPPQETPLTPHIFKGLGLVYNLTSQSEISNCTQFLRKKNMLILAYETVLRATGPLPWGPEGPAPRSPRPP